MMAGTAMALAASAVPVSGPAHLAGGGVGRLGGSVRRTSMDGNGSAAFADVATAMDAAIPDGGVDGGPLPPHLQRILLEVARSGQCTTLLWKGRSLWSSGASDAASAAGAVSPPPSGVASANCGSGGLSGPLTSSSPPHAGTTSSLKQLHSSPRHFPPRKKRRNGLKSGIGRRRYGGSDSKGTGNGAKTTGCGASSASSSTTATTTTATATTTAAAKRLPLVLIRTSLGSSASGTASTAPLPSATPGVSNAASGGPGSNYSGRTSGSELSHGDDESTHYECDSEGTSATTNSELSIGNELRAAARKRANKRSAAGQTGRKRNTDGAPSRGAEEEDNEPRYRSLQEAIGMALALVLDHTYRKCGGYRLSPAERRKREGLVAGGGPLSSLVAADWRRNKLGGMAVGLSAPFSKQTSPSEAAFRERREKLLSMLGCGGSSGASLSSRRAGFQDDEDGSGRGGSSGNASDASIGSGPRMPSSSNPRRSHMGEAAALDVDGGDGPPFTIQRVAEILVSPERYYTQTHKLCNGLEKLLLVTSPASAFGGSTGGETSQSLLEEREIVALANERGREETVQRQRFLKRQLSSDCDPVLQMNVNVETTEAKNSDVAIHTHESSSGETVVASSLKPVTENGSSHCSSMATAERYVSDASYGHVNAGVVASPSNALSSSSLAVGINGLMVDMLNSHPKSLDENGTAPERGEPVDLVGAASTSLRNKFVAESGRCESKERANPAASTSLTASVRETPLSIARGASPPPDVAPVSLPSSCDASSPLGTGIPGDHTLSPSSGDYDQLRQHLQESDSTSSLGETAPPEPTHLQEIARAPSPIMFAGNPGAGTSSMENSHIPVSQALQMHPSATLAGAAALGSPPGVQMEIVIESSAAPTAPVGPSSAAAADVADLDVERGSASDVDSESGDDVSLDDSASDRSDGSDSGSGTGYYEPFTAARVMALNRMQQQQQQRREQYLQSKAMAAVAAAANHQQSDGYRPPPDSEYQSGDSIDSTVAEDSGGSDSSNSDLAD